MCLHGLLKPFTGGGLAHFSGRFGPEMCLSPSLLHGDSPILVVSCHKNPDSPPYADSLL